MHTEKRVRALFRKIKVDSFSDFCKDSDLVIEEMGFLGYSSPFTGNVSINLKKINEYKLSRPVLIGILAHELGHQISYRKRFFFSRWLFLWNYYLYIPKRRKIEYEADSFAVQRGYGKEIMALTLSDRKIFSGKLLEFIEKAYPSPDDIRGLIKKYP